MRCHHKASSHSFLLLFEKEMEFISFIIQLKKLVYRSIPIICKILSCNIKISFLIFYGFFPSKFRTPIFSRKNGIRKEQHPGSSAIGAAQSAAVVWFHLLGMCFVMLKEILPRVPFVSEEFHFPFSYGFRPSILSSAWRSWDWSSAVIRT
jgi:hypothetical protein